MDRSGNSPSYLVWQQILQRMKVCVEAHNTDVLFKVPAVPKYQQKAPQYGQQSISEKRKAETQLDDLEFAKSKRFKIMQNQAGMPRADTQFSSSQFDIQNNNDPNSRQSYSSRF